MRAACQFRRSGNPEPPAGFENGSPACGTELRLFSRELTLAVLRPSGCAGFFSGCHERELLSSLRAQASPCGASHLGARMPGHTGSRSACPRQKAQARCLWRGLHCSRACGIFLDQGSTLCLLHWQVNSLPLNPPGKPCINP